jgi:RNA-directed DNA polymerase
MSGDVHVRFCESGGVRLPGATHLVVLCRSEAEARQALEQVRVWTVSAGLTLHPVKTRIVDARQVGGFDFLGYHFERGLRWPRRKSLEKLKQTIRAKTRRRNGQSLAVVITNLNRSLTGWYEYFKHSHRPTFAMVDKWVRMRMRRLLRQRRDGRGRHPGWDHLRWPNDFFHQQGLFSMELALALAVQSSPR